MGNYFVTLLRICNYYELLQKLHIEDKIDTVLDNYKI